MATPPIFSVFGRSPIKPLQKHMEAVRACVDQLLPFVGTAKQGDWAHADKIQQQIAQLENDADTIKGDIRAHLPKSYFLPVARTDLLELLTVQDTIANRTKDIVGIMLGRKMILPAPIEASFIIFTQRCVDAVHQAEQAINELDELFETGFSGNEVDIIEDMINKLSAIEHDTDQQQITLRRQLFDIENELPPVNVMFLYRIIEWTGGLADTARKVGARLHILLAK